MNSFPSSFEGKKSVRKKNENSKNERTLNLPRDIDRCQKENCVSV